MVPVWDDLHIRRVSTQREHELLVDMDRRMFRPSDMFGIKDFQQGLCWLIVCNGEPAGSIVMLPDIDLDSEAHEIVMPKSLYIASTGILPAWQRHRLGSIAKAFELSYAKTHGFTTMVTMCRSRNAAMLRINERFGFVPRHCVPDVYDQPRDDAVVLELLVR